VQRVPGHVVALGLVAAAIASIAWWGGIAVGPAAAPDAAEHIRYAAYFDRTGHLPPKSVNYEYSSPPAYALSAVYLQRLAKDLHVPDGAPLRVLPTPVRRLGWLALLAAVGAALASRTLSPRRRAGAACLAAALVFAAVVAALARARAVPWSSGQLISLVSACTLVVVTGALARRVAPSRAVAAAVAVVAMPVVLREAVVFHPELPFAAVVALALLAFVRGAEAGWGSRYAVLVGGLVGVAALTRQTAAVVALALGAAALLAGRREAVRFVAVAAVAVAVIAGPWWGYQASRFGNPIQSNLDRPGYLLPHGEPRSFYVSFPVRDLALHPYRNAFRNELLPKFHADLWSDWYGVDRNYWEKPSVADRVLASSQSLLGFGGDALVIAGLVVFGVPALRRARGAQPLVLALVLLTALAWLAFVVTLVRYPQTSGDPIKSSYLLFIAPAAAIFGVAYGDRLWRDWRGRAGLTLWSFLYAASFAAVLVTTY
jgi:hypothetical protein